MGMINLFSGGDVARAEQREYGPAELTIDNDADLFRGFGKKELVRVWMSHGDKMTSMPKGWQALAHSGNSPLRPLPILAGGSSAFSFILKWRTRRGGGRFSRISSFASAVVSRPGPWSTSSRLVKKIREQVGDGRVLCAQRRRRFFGGCDVWFTRLSEKDWSASSSTMGFCGRTRPSGFANYSPSGLVRAFAMSMPAKVPCPTSGSGRS